MARNGVQYDDVKQAIDKLLSRGDAPSVQRIREVLGTGSFTTISEHFRLWRKEREQNRDTPPPKGVPDVVVSAAAELWREAQEEANQALTHYRDDANRQIEAAQLEVRDAAQQVANAQQRESALAEHLRHTEQRLEALNRELATSQSQEQQWHQQAEALAKEAHVYKQQCESNDQQLKTQEKQFVAQQQQLEKTWQARLAQEEKRNEAAEGKLMALLDTLRQERTQEEKSAQKRWQQMEQRTLSLDNELNLEKEKRHQSQLDNSALTQRIAELEQQNTHLKQQQEQLQAQLQEALNTLDQQRKNSAQEAQWQGQLREQMASLRTQLDTLSEHKPPANKKPSR